jgi:hypothetical protein
MSRAATRGKRRLFLVIVGIAALGWALWVEVVVPRLIPLAGSTARRARAGAVVMSMQPSVSRQWVADAAGSAAASTADRTEGGLVESRVTLKPAASGGPGADHCGLAGSPIAGALATIETCQAKYQAIRDYTCTFSKRERIQGRLTPLHVLSMKVRTQPRSIYVRFQQPAAGREAIYIAGQNNGKVLAHDVGLNKLLAGTLRLDPTGSRAMQDNRHPITEAGIGPLLTTLETRWSSELDPTESVVDIRTGQKRNGRPCKMIETTHPCRQPEYMFYRVRLFIDDQIGLPIHFEAYDWPATAQTPAELMEEYSYKDIKLNVGLSDRDFDVSNADYAFGRF